MSSVGGSGGLSPALHELDAAIALLWNVKENEKSNLQKWEWSPASPLTQISSKWSTMYALRQATRATRASRCLQCISGARTASQLVPSANFPQSNSKNGNHPGRAAHASLAVGAAAAAFLWMSILTVHAEEPERPIFKKTEVEASFSPFLYALAHFQ